MATYTLKRPEGAPSRYRIDYRGELNEAQYQAATALEGPVLVVAGAGSGKTRTLVYRVARLIESGIAPRSILLLTFTRRAAQEMLRRAESLLGGGAGEVVGGTFHSFASMVLRRYGRVFGWPDTFSILDRGDSEDAIHLVRNRLGLAATDRRFPRKQTLASIFSAAVNLDLAVPEIVESDYPHLAEEIPHILRCRDAYGEYKSQRRLLDYDDLLVHLRDHLRDVPEFAERLGQAFRHVMVDEYQDTNALQAEIVELVARDHRNVMVVGDDAQSIYAFRGARVRNILEFPDHFPGTRIIALEENYRSTQPILDLSNAILAAAAEKHEKTLFTRRAGGDKPILVPAPDEATQSRFVCQRILELHEEGVSLSDIAVLFRSSFHSFDLEVELARAGVPFVKRGGFRFLETAHVKDLIAHLRVIANPRDAVSWNRILLLLEGVGPKAAERALEWLAAEDRAPSALGQLAAAGGWRGSAATGLRELGGLLGRLEGLREQPVALVETALAHYRPVLERVHRDDAPRRLRDLEQLAVLASRYTSLDRLLSDMALEPPSDAVGGALAVDVAADEMLTLSTIHSAKGLEWHTVFVLWLAEGRFPSAYSTDDDEIEEERRLFYVACTRAATNLVLTYPVAFADRVAGFAVGQPSRFLSEVPVGLLEPVLLVEED